MSKKSTINDIAQQLGVSKSLVSFVLTGKSEEKRIATETSQKVLELAEELNYTPNYHAKSLRKGKPNTLGVIVADISNPFFATIARHVEIEASKIGYRVVFSNSNEDPQTFKTQLDILKSGQVDGFILTPPIGSEKVLLDLNEQNIPYVIVDRLFESVEAHSVNVKNYQAAYKATERIIQNHRKKIALINVNYELLTMKQRAEGYIDALEDNGIEINESLIKHLNFSHDKNLLMEVMKDIVQNGADGVLFTTNKLGVYGIECLRELGMETFENMSVISFDDTLTYRVSYVPITAIEQPFGQISKEAVRILANAIDGNYSKRQYESLELDVEFNYRESCKKLF